MGFLDAELSITLVADAEMAEIAGRFGRQPRPTDVLAFSMLEGPGSEHRAECLGDVVISLPTAERQARENRRSLAFELRDLLIHGTLHLVGMDHEYGPDTRSMRELEAHLRWEIARAS
ncbi:MAG: rRNA maturation RNase YbeY [bacterium]|nr:rRNA maturation RNase YbeY [bacterium]